jgi:hypothetical protein
MQQLSAARRPSLQTMTSRLSMTFCLADGWKRGAAGVKVFLAADRVPNESG